MTQEDYEARLRELVNQNIEYADEIAARDGRIQALHARIRELETQLSHEKGVISTLKQLYHSIDNKIMRTLTERGQHKKVRASTHPAISGDSTSNYDSLIRIAREYDVNEFFALKKRVHAHDLRLGYRLVAKSYRVTRDSGIAGAKRIYNVKADK